MALIVLLKGVNIGGHRTFKPTTLAKALSRWGAVNIGAAGTFVMRKRISRTQLRAEIERRLPFTTDIVICDGREILDLVSSNPFVGQPAGRAIIQFASVLTQRLRPTAALPFQLPPTGRWCVRVLGYLGQLEKRIGVPMTARSWTTILSIARVLQAEAT